MSTILDDLSGFAFEDLMEDVFRNLGYENVRQAERTADEGRDILMEERTDGQRRAVVVECKHTDTVGRPVVQKLHSAIATFEYRGPKRGMVVTTGRFSGPAREYAQRLRENGDPYPIELLDGEDLRDIADEIGLDLYNGRIEILCDETLRPADSPESVDAPVREAFRDIHNIDPNRLPDPHAAVTFRPVVSIRAETNAVFETSVGVVHRVHDQTAMLVYADRGQPTRAGADVARLVAENRHDTVDIDREWRVFDDVETPRFGQTETEYTEWATEELKRAYTTTVRYTGDNNVTYTRTCEPNASDISVQSVDPVYLPQVRQTIRLQGYTYPYEYVAAGSSWVTREDGIHRCVHCGEDHPGEVYTFCAYCGSINCERHIETERLTGDPVCTGCAVTGQFAFQTNYFSDEQHRARFREQWSEMPLSEKAMENKTLAAAASVGAVLLVLFVLVLVASLV